MSIEKKLSKISKTGYVYRVYTKIQGKRKTRQFERKIDAIDWEREQKTKELKGELSFHDLSSLTFEEFAQIWLKRHAEVRKAYSSALRDKSILRIYLNPTFGDIDVKAISPEMIENLITSLVREGVLKNATINRILTLIKKMFNDAIKWRRLQFNPMTAVSMLPEEPPRLNYWSAKEIEQFLHVAAESRYYLLYLTALNTGMRFGELAGLKWDCIDFKNRLITIKRSYIKELKEIRNTTKSRKV